MRSTAKVTYTDGHVDEAPLTPRVITSAEEHAQKEGWAPGEASKIRQSYYMAYLAQRYAGNTTMPYAQWLEEVADIDVETPTAENLPSSRVARRFAGHAVVPARGPFRRHAVGMEA